ncbi:MAG: DUF559 domain-containing protein [Kiritimatiellae bacterium]|nr:DUF559 domain-containing protein [Kiritimatiellia bacterium]
MADPWAKFRNLCAYYADCVKCSERSQEYLFPNQLGISFMMPRLPSNWYATSDPFNVETSSADAFVRNALLEASDEEDLFIGYPLQSFISPAGTACLCPIMTFPVSKLTAIAGCHTGMTMQIDSIGISINQDWIEYHVPKTEQTAFRRSCEKADDADGIVDVKLVLNYIARRFGVQCFSPDAMSFSIRHSQSGKGLLNTALLFAGGKTQYTKALVAELRRISKEPDAVLDQTSLAYVFRDPPLPDGSIGGIDGGGKRIPVSFTKRRMNAGQFAAVENALNRHVAKVVGPPGTGKSFMAVNLIANEVLHGGRVLFTSRNHKAVHAICDKAPEAIDDPDFPLVAFCTTPVNPTNLDWRQSQTLVDERTSLARARLADESAAGAIPPALTAAIRSSELLDKALARYRDAESGIERYDLLRNKIAGFERLLVDIDKLVASVPACRRDAPETVSLLERIESDLADAPKRHFLVRLADTIGMLLRRNRCVRATTMEELAAIAPGAVNAFLAPNTVRKEVRRLLKVLKARAVVKQLEAAELDALNAEASQCNYDALKDCAKTALFDAEAAAQKAYAERLLDAISSVANADCIVERCKHLSASALKNELLPFMGAVDGGAEYAGALAAFQDYLKIFPAWAATMLSLNRASPCLPGVYSLAIIDEASQCDIPPMIPVLYRAQRIAIVGDPSQFPPVITLKKRRDQALMRHHRLDSPECSRFAYGENTAFSVVRHEAILLNEHFRCADGIADYFNTEFYGGALRLCCETGRTAHAAIGAFKPGMQWIDAPGGDDAEIEAALEFLKSLKLRAFAGSIGVISPLRNLADRFKTDAANAKTSLPCQFDIHSQVNTANGFQGGECDIILFLLGLNDSRKHGEEWYITSADNKYIYNVSVSRAKYLFVAFGDRRRAATCGLAHIRKLIPEARPPCNIRTGPGEDLLRNALAKAGISTEAQYPIAGRYLDLAIPSCKIDIEVDGQAWHLDRNGCRKADDIHRDIMLESLGWRVIRFWHREIVQNVQSCIDRVRQALA